MKRGFTLIELLIVVAISAMISSLAIVYSHTGQDQVTLSIEAAKISQMILQAKNLAISTYSGTGQTSCAYGVVFNFPAQTFSLFNYSPPLTPAGRCPTAASTTAVVADSMKEYAASSWQVPVSQGVVMKSSAPGNDVLTMALFYPPLPVTLISRDTAFPVTFLSPGQVSKVYLETTNGSASAQVSVSPGGQVDFN